MSTRDRVRAAELQRQKDEAYREAKRAALPPMSIGKHKPLPVIIYEQILLPPPQRFA